MDHLATIFFVPEFNMKVQLLNVFKIPLREYCTPNTCSAGCFKIPLQTAPRTSGEKESII